MATDRALSKIADIAERADRDFMAGRTAFLAKPGMTWGGDDDENSALLIEAIEAQGWELRHVAFDQSYLRHVYRRNEMFRSLR